MATLAPVVEEFGGRLSALGWVSDLLVAGSLAMGDYVPRISDLDLMPTMAEYTLTPFARVHVAAGGPSGTLEREIYRVAPPGSCGG